MWSHLPRHQTLCHPWGHPGKVGVIYFDPSSTQGPSRKGVARGWSEAALAGALPRPSASHQWAQTRRNRISRPRSWNQSPDPPWTELRLCRLMWGPGGGTEVSSEALAETAVHHRRIRLSRRCLLPVFPSICPGPRVYGRCFVAVSRMSLVFTQLKPAIRTDSRGHQGKSRESVCR